MATQVLPVPLISQGDTAYCTYACTSMVLRYFGIVKSVGQVISEVTIPSSLSGFDDFTSLPGTNIPNIYQSYAVIREYMQDQGLDAQIFHGQDLDSIKENIDRGNPILVSIVVDKKAHSWILRGYTDQSGQEAIIYNEPHDELNGHDPITYDTDDTPDGIPGRTMDFDTFVEDHWHDEIPAADRMMLVVSVFGIGRGGHTKFDWRGSAARTYQAVLYHASQYADNMIRGDFVGAFIEGSILVIGSIALGISYIQQTGQTISNWGDDLIARGGIFVPLGHFVRAYGEVIDAVSGIGGLMLEWVMDLIDGIVDMIDGNTSGGTIRNVGEIDVYVVEILNVNPWRSRSGRNWEDIGGSWGIYVPSGQVIDIDVDWEISLWGTGIDSWNLSRSVNYNSGTLIKNNRGSSTNHVKRFVTEVEGMNQFWMGFGEDRCPYGRDGALTRVQCKVEASVTYNGESKNISISKSIYGFSA